MTKPHVLTEFRSVLAELAELLRREGVYTDFAFLFRRCSVLATAAVAEPQAAEALKDYFSYMPSGPGTFQDLVIWRDSFEERKAINQQLNSLRERMISLAKSL